MRVSRFGLTIGMLVALAVAPTASAAAPPVTVLQIDIVFATGEEFTATGGVLCESGTAVTDSIFFAGFRGNGAGVGTFHLIKTLTCDDGSGTFQIKVEASTAPTSPGTIGSFAVVSGTGDYTRLRGAGSLVGTGNPDGIVDVYTGRLTN